MLKKPLACSFVIVAVDGGFLDQPVQVRWRGHHAHSDPAFLHELSSRKLADEDQAPNETR
jgi:hypothetical protein